MCGTMSLTVLPKTFGCLFCATCQKTNINVYCFNSIKDFTTNNFPFCLSLQSPELEFRHELMHRLNKLDTEMELEMAPNHQHNLSNSPSSSSSLSAYGSQVYESYGKEYYYEPKHHRECSDLDDQFLRPPLWEDITSSIQNIDPENAIMLGALTGATQVKLEATDDAFLESLSSPLLSSLDIKTEKVYRQNLNNNTIHVNHNLGQNNNSYLVQSNYQTHQPQQMNGYDMVQQQNSQNYYWPNQPQNHQHYQESPVCNGPKYSPQPNLCSPISRLMYVPPLTPPRSDPESMGNPYQHQQLQHPVQNCNSLMNSQGNFLPPPHLAHQNHQQNHAILHEIDTSHIFSESSKNGANGCEISAALNQPSIILTSSGVKTMVGRYNRRKNPELEKRRIHHCDFLGNYTAAWKSIDVQKD